MILRGGAMRISIPVQVHDGPPDELHSPSIILSADPCRFIRQGFAFCGVGAKLRAHPQHDPGNCERSIRAMIDRSSLRAER
jgi:hypothetical protein